MDPCLSRLEASLEGASDEAALETNLRALVACGQEVRLNERGLAVVRLLLERQGPPRGRYGALVAGAIAELAKDPDNRRPLTFDLLVDRLLAALEGDDPATGVQAYRGLGNLCFDNRAARQMIFDKGMLTVLPHSLDRLGNTVETRAVAFAFLLNFLADEDDLQKKAVAAGLIATLEDEISLLAIEPNPHVTHVLAVLGTLTEHLGDSWLSPSMCANLTEILGRTENGETSVACLELIHSQLERDETKTYLADRGICELIYQLVEKYKNLADEEEERAVLKMACDAIVLVLTGDDAMNRLYDDGKGITYRNMLNWLQSDDDDLLSTGILAMGNFARNDKHCVQMVNEGLADDLIELLSRRQSDDNDSKLQYAILSTIRNLAILPQNKPKMIRSGLIRILLQMLDSKQSHVIFKLLGTLRIIIDGQEKEASDLSGDGRLVKKIALWYASSDHIGVHGEASRLLAWLIKNGKSYESFGSIVETEGCVRCLVEMLSSNYTMMQNEAIVALVVLLASKTPALDAACISANIGEHVKFLLSKQKDASCREVFENVICLCQRLGESPSILCHLQDSGLNVTLQELLSAAKIWDLLAKVEQLLQKLNS